MTDPDCWENLEQLSITPLHAPTNDTTERAPQTEPQSQTPTTDSVDQALKEALKNPRERANVLRIDADVHKFIQDKTRCTLDFSYDLTSYQMYGLQTQSVPLGNGLSRVIAHKTQNTKPPPIRVIDIKDMYKPPESEKKQTPLEVTIKRRQGGSTTQPAEEKTSRPTSASNRSRSVKQREEEYKQARERILGDGCASDGPLSTVDDPEEDSKGRKAVFRDREKELQDPDYRRGAGIFQSEPKPTVYTAPAYNQDYPALPGAAGAVPPGRHLPPGQQTLFLQPPGPQMGSRPTQLGFSIRPGLPYPPPPCHFPQAGGYRMQTAVTPPASQPFHQTGFGGVQGATLPGVSAPMIPFPPMFGQQYQAYGIQGPLMRNPYVNVAQGQQPGTPAKNSVPMHQMTMRAKSVASPHAETNVQRDR